MNAENPIEPNEIADNYQALSEYHELVARLAAAREAISDEEDSILHAFSELIGDRRAEFGEATATRNAFTMAEYREVYGETLPTITTEGLTAAEREPLEWLGIIGPDETFHLPFNPRTGKRMHIWPVDDGLNVDYDLLQEFTVPQAAVTIFHISDTHLGYRNRTDPRGKGKTIWVDGADSISAFEAVLQQAIDEDIDAVVHTGDLFDHDVDQATLERSISALKTLEDGGIPFYFVLGDHDRDAIGGAIPAATDAIASLQSLCESGTVIHCDTSGQQLPGSCVTLYGVDASGIGFSEIQAGYTLKGWSPTTITLDGAGPDGLNILCLHEPVEIQVLRETIRTTERKGQPLDLILLGHEHLPPFDGQWQTTVDGVSVAVAGPTIPISSAFKDQPPGYNRIRIGSNGNFGVDRRQVPDVAST